MDVLDVGIDVGTEGSWPSPLPTRWHQNARLAERSRQWVAGPLQLSVTETELGSGRRLDLVVSNRARRTQGTVALERVRVLFDAHPRLLLEHGWQSWSPVGRKLVTDVGPSRRLAPAWVRGTYHAVPELAGRAVCGDQFLLMADGCIAGTSQVSGLIGFLDGAQHLSTILATSSGAAAFALFDSVSLAPGEERRLDPLWYATGDPGQLYSEYLDHCGSEARARTGARNVFGWSSWYQYFWKLTPQACRSNLELAGSHGLDVFHLDDGYQASVGDWLVPNSRFEKDRPEDLAAAITDRGMRAGIWTAPFVASPSSILARRHPEWMAHAPGVSRSSEAPCRAMWNPQAWHGWAYALDTTRLDVLDHLRVTYHDLAEQGWAFHKIDFCYAAAMPARRAAGHRFTRAQALRMGLQAVRDGIGTDAVLLGCGMPLAQGVGLVDAMRVSADTAPRWRPGVVRLPGYSDLMPSARATLSATLLRAPMHRRLWLNDPDCLLLRRSRSKLGPNERLVMAATAIGTGAFTMVSDDLRTYREPEWRLLERIDQLRVAGDRRVDLTDPFAAAPRVLGGELQLDVQWESGDQRLDDRAPLWADGVAEPKTNRPGSRVLMAAGWPPELPWAILRQV
ncbi:MAG: alpha-galactosidase [Actinomycetota bacterium]|nr:alpha-galactosidase [Actinomycetota bacterium]